MSLLTADELKKAIVGKQLFTEQGLQSNLRPGGKRLPAWNAT